MHSTSKVERNGGHAALLAAASCVVVGLSALTAQGQEVTRHSNGSATYRWDLDAPIEARSFLATSVPGAFSGADVADLIGATTFYSNGFNGAGTITSNIEAGHIWNGHETLGHVTSRTNHASAPGASFGTPAYDLHATWVGQIIGGRPTAIPQPWQAGIAPQTDLRSGAIATAWTGNAYATSFNVTMNSLATPYTSAVSGFGAVNVINSSWGIASPSGSEAAGGVNSVTMLMDSLANQNRFTTAVVAAGNDGATATPMVGAPASGYNVISVGALANNGSNEYDTVAVFSSRGPQDYRDPNVTVLAATARRAAVDIVAPGHRLMAAHYGGQTGGNDASLSGSGPLSIGPAFYNPDIQGTSFAAPVVAGSVSLMHHAAQGLGLPTDARDTRVIKATLINAARKIPGWNNGQVPHPNGNGGVRTTDALDMVSGGGALDMDRTWYQYTQGQTDIPGLAGGVTSEALGWDYAVVNLGGATDIVIDAPLSGEFRATLTWFREREYVSASTQNDVGFADLDLQVWDSTFTTLIAESVSEYSEIEHLAFTLPSEGYYGLRVVYDENRFGTLTSEEFGIAWYGTAVPEPGMAMLMALALPLAARRRRA